MSIRLCPKCRGIDNKGLIEIICRCYDYENSKLTRFIVKNLCQELGINLLKKHVGNKNIKAN